MKILIVRLSSIGDIVLATPLIRCLRNKYPSAQIDFILKEKYAEILSANPYISNLVLFNGNLIKFAKKIKAEKYNIIIDIHRNFRSFILTLFSNAQIVRYKNFLFQRFLLTELGLNFYRQKIPVAQRYLAAVKQLGVVDDNKGIDFFIDEKIKNKFVQLYKFEYISICPVAIWKTKRWPKENFIALAKKIIEKYNYNILIFGGKTDFEYCESIKNQIGYTEKTKNLCGLSLQETAVVLTKCKHLLTNDTGLMHIAEALKIPVVAFFGPTVEEFGFYPQSAKSKVFAKNISCQPCSTKGSQICPGGHFRCMKDITVDEVFSYCAANL
ncbi:MAG: lipopolysaccharide heptosyltransferase II [Elusimicrobiota bacterium]